MFNECIQMERGEASKNGFMSLFLSFSVNVYVESMNN